MEHGRVSRSKRSQARKQRARRASVNRTPAPVPDLTRKPVIEVHESRATRMGNAILADFTLIECPTWGITLDAEGRPDLVREMPEWPRTHVHPLCLGCGRTISTDATCPRMHPPEKALAMILRLRMPVAEQHEELAA